MPPIRRKPNRPGPAGRRPKVAGRGAGSAPADNRPAEEPTDTAPVPEQNPTPSAPEPPQKPAEPTETAAPEAKATTPDTANAAPEPAAEPETKVPDPDKKAAGPAASSSEPRAAAAGATAADPVSADAKKVEPADATNSRTEPGATADATSEAADEPAKETRKRVIPGRVSSLRRSSKDAPAEATADGAASGSRGRLDRWSTVVVVAAVAVVLAVIAVIAYLKPGADVSNEAWVNNEATSQVTAAARGALETLYTYKADTVDKDFDAARGVLDKQMLDEFNRTADTTKSAVVQTKTATTAQVTDVGVKVLSDDRAELLASMNVSASNNGQAQGSAQGPLSVDMVKVGDKWLLSKISDQ